MPPPVGNRRPATAKSTASSAAARLRWKSRRGWLELDLLLATFWQQHGDALSEEEEAMLAQWLEMDDEHLWVLLAAPPPHGTALSLARKLRPAATATPFPQPTQDTPQGDPR